MSVIPRPSGPRCTRIQLVLIILILSLLSASGATAGFLYDPILEPIVTAEFSADFAALVAHATVGGVRVNMVTLIDPRGLLPELDLSDELFGTAELLLGETPTINQAPIETGIFSASIPSSFFPVLQSGSVGFWFLATDTDDGLFAMDFLALNIQTASGTVISLIDSNDGFGIGLADGGTLPAPLPLSIPIDATGTGFDESISSKNIHRVPASEPASLSLLAAGLLAIWNRRTESHRSRRTSAAPLQISPKTKKRNASRA